MFGSNAKLIATPLTPPSEPPVYTCVIRGEHTRGDDQDTLEFHLPISFDIPGYGTVPVVFICGFWGCRHKADGEVGLIFFGHYVEMLNRCRVVGAANTA